MRGIRAGVLLFIALGAVASACASEAIGPTAALETGVSRRHDEPAAPPFSAAPPPAQADRRRRAAIRCGPSRCAR